MDCLVVGGMEWEDGMEGERGSGWEGGMYCYDECFKVVVVFVSILVFVLVLVLLMRGCKSELLLG